MSGCVAVINAGSSSIKFSVVQTEDSGALTAAAHGQVEGIGATARFEVSDHTRQFLIDEWFANAM